MTTTKIDHDWIHLEGFSFPCILGLLDWEQHTSQTLSIELSMGLDLDPAAAGDLARSVNYAATVDQVQFIAEHGHWRMLESMGAAIARLLLAPPALGEARSQVMRAVVRLRKPDVFRGRAVPSIEIRRDRAWCELALLPVSSSGARVEILQESVESGAYRVHLDEDSAWTPPPEMACAVISGRVRNGSDELGSGETLVRGGPEVRAVTAACLLAVGPRSALGRGREMP